MNKKYKKTDIEKANAKEILEGMHWGCLKVVDEIPEYSRSGNRRLRQFNVVCDRGSLHRRTIMGLQDRPPKRCSICSRRINKVIGGLRDKKFRQWANDMAVAIMEKRIGCHKLNH